MEKILFVNSSPNREGNTYRIGEELLKDKEHDVLQMADYRISQYGQVFDDDEIKEVLKKIDECDILVIGEIRDKETMEAAIETAESGHLVIGTLHTKSCAETVDRMINFYEVGDQSQVKYLIASLLKLVISQRLIKNKKGTLSLVPEVMVVDNVVSGLIRKEKLTTSEIEDAIQSGSNNGSIGLINSLAKLFTDDIITLDQAKAQVEEKNIEVLNRTIMQMKLKKEEEANKVNI